MLYWARHLCAVQTISGSGAMDFLHRNRITVIIIIDPQRHTGELEAL